MIGSPRNTHARGMRPTRPGDLTGRQHAEDLRRLTAGKAHTRAPVQTADSQEAAYLDGWGAGYEAGVETVLGLLRDAGADLDDDDTEDEA